MTQPSESETKFLDFDWSDERWQQYLGNLYPTPPATSILKYKKKWYQMTVDPQFDVSSKLGEPEPSAAATASTTPDRSDPNVAQSTAAPTSGTRTAAPTPSTRGAKLWTAISSFLLVLAILLHFGSIIPSKLSPRFRRASLLCYTLGFAGSIISSNGLPKLNAEWWQMVLYHDGSQSCLMTMVAFPINFWISMISPLLSAAMYLSESLPTIATLQPILRQPHLNQLITLIKNNKYALCGTRADVEIYGGILVFIIGLAGRLPFFAGLMYWNTLRVKYAVNSYTKSAFTKMNNQITGVLNHPSAPKALLSIYTKVASILYKYGGAQA